jgi:hypothetical protein
VLLAPRAPFGPVRRINIRSGVEWPFPARERQLLAREEADGS